MAYREIEGWRQILETQDAERKAYDEACERRAKEKAELDEKEFWEQDQEEVDPATMGIGECGLYEEDPEELADVEDVDEEIDFSGYQLDEADLREPLTKASDLLGMPASTASLDGQDSVSLAEAIRELTKALKEKKGLNEAATSTDAGWLAWVGGEDSIKDWDEATRKASRKLFDDLVAKGKLDGTTGASTPEAQAADILRMQKDYKKATGFEPPTGWDDMEADKQEEILAKRGADSKKALDAAKKFYEKWLDDPDFREKNALKDKDGATVMKPANPEKPNSKGTVVAGTDPNSEGAKLFKSYFDQMTPEDREEFDRFASERGRRFTTKHYAPHKIDSLNKKGTLHGKDGDDDENVNPLAQHGLDQTFNADNADDDMMDDPENGEEFYSQFDPDYQTVSHEGVAQHIIDVATQYGKEHGGMTAQEVFDMFAQNDRMRKIRNTVRAKGMEGKELTDYQLEYIFDTLSPAELEKFKAELKAEAKDEKEKTFIDYLFRFGKERQVSLKDMLKEFGVAADQSGDTGAGTQQGDTLIYVIICALAYFYGVRQDEADELWRVKASQAPTKRDKELGVEPRKYSRHLACLILQGLFDELHDYQMKGAPKVTIPQSPAEGPKIKAKEWAEVQKKLGGLLMLIRLRADKAEFDGAMNEIKSRMEQYQGSAGSKGEREARKLKTYLTKEQNDEFQALLQQVRDDYSKMTDDAKIRLIELDRMRVGDTLTDAQAKAKKAYDTAMKKSPEAFDVTVKKIAKSFLAGGSNNVSRDGIDVYAKAEA